VHNCRAPAPYPENVERRHLFGHRQEYPRNIFDVMTRDEEIRYSSRTRASTDQFKYVQKLRHALAGLLKNLPPELKNTPEARLLETAAEYNIVHLIYRAKNYEGHSKDYEFSRISMQEHWHAGYHDALRTATLFGLHENLQRILSTSAGCALFLNT
jgi:NTE family protein